MGEKPQNIKHRHISLGVLAHVDAGKTTLSEGLLFKCGRIRKIGRVDHKDAYLDTYELERERGITIFSKQAVFSMGDMEVTLLDTPGHVDFSAEMERTLQVLDYAILVINGADGVQGHTQTLWRLLTQYKIPTFLFVNKMDQEGTDRERLLEELKKKLSGCCVDFSGELECFGAEAAGKKENPVDNSGKFPSAEGMQLKDNASEAEKENISGTQGASDKITGKLPGNRNDRKKGRGRADPGAKAFSMLLWICPEDGRRRCFYPWNGDLHGSTVLSRRIRSQDL